MVRHSFFRCLFHWVYFNNRVTFFCTFYNFMLLLLLSIILIVDLCSLATLKNVFIVSGCNDGAINIHIRKNN